MNAYQVGGKVGTVGAWVLSKSFHVGALAVAGAGSFGEGVLDVGGEKLVEYNHINETARVAREVATKAKMAELRQLHAAKLLALNAPAAPAAPVAPAPMAVAS